MRLKTTSFCAVFVLFIDAAASAQINQYLFQDINLPGTHLWWRAGKWSRGWARRRLTNA
jgi:hypothetical protein